MSTAMLKEQVQAVLEREPALLPSAVAAELQVSEAQVVFALPKAMAVRVDGSFCEQLLTELAGWGPVTTIVHSCASIFEVKAPFPKGKNARGYYNLMGREGQLHGHLRIDLVTDIALVSKPFMGSESHYLGFFTEQGESIFKVYLGRDEKRQLFPEQLEKFAQLKTQYGE
ncbi:heme utilization cystosolic carrier protein HutX [Psychromonas ossibalaenae]|uniref:heme utilization cystosolic carrier protein HutX n=1 Tax=Psychromonas ossibalaenae TaxID=444922 RepID=UPI0003A72FFE|nr:heme utilization cystosolic carrier protein HutX [Psychromonas ossibalaenae]